MTSHVSLIRRVQLRSKEYYTRDAVHTADLRDFPAYLLPAILENPAVATNAVAYQEIYSAKND